MKPMSMIDKPFCFISFFPPFSMYNVFGLAYTVYKYFLFRQVFFKRFLKKSRDLQERPQEFFVALFTFYHLLYLRCFIRFPQSGMFVLKGSEIFIFHFAIRIPHSAFDSFKFPGCRRPVCSFALTSEGFHNPRSPPSRLRESVF